MLPRARRLGVDPEASAQVISFLVAAAIFLGAIATVLVSTRNTNHDSSSADAATGTLQAQGLADLIMGSAGVGWSGGADHVSRLGLSATNGSGLQQSSVDALKGALLVSSSNSKVDYPDAHDSLGLPAGEDFHLRMYPVGMNLIYNTSLSGLHVGYIGDWTDLPAIGVPFNTPISQMPAIANQMENISMVLNSTNERQILRTIGTSFVDRIYITSSQPTISVDNPSPIPDVPLLTYLGQQNLEGDVYPDIKAYLDANLPGRLSKYDIFIIGSGVDQSAMTSNAVKNGFRDWVLNGGTLVVLGSNSQNFQWIQPLFALGVSTANGAPTAPDVSHPILKQPNDLDWTHYNNHGLTWDIKDSGTGAHYNDFIHVITEGSEDVLAISKDGAFGTGRIILTTYMPREISASLGQTEAVHFFQNLALYADRANLFLDYGPTAPPNTAVSVAVRESWLWDDTLGQVPIRVEIQTWS
jgi:hypothetical protein